MDHGASAVAGGAPPLRFLRRAFCAQGWPSVCPGPCPPPFGGPAPGFLRNRRAALVLGAVPVPPAGRGPPAPRVLADTCRFSLSCVCAFVWHNHLSWSEVPSALMTDVPGCAGRLSRGASHAGDLAAGLPGVRGRRGVAGHTPSAPRCARRGFVPPSVPARHGLCRCGRGTRGGRLV